MSNNDGKLAYSESLSWFIYFPEQLSARWPVHMPLPIHKQVRQFFWSRNIVRSIGSRTSLLNDSSSRSVHFRESRSFVTRRQRFDFKALKRCVAAACRCWHHKWVGRGTVMQARRSWCMKYLVSASMLCVWVFSIWWTFTRLSQCEQGMTRGIWAGRYQ